jgi:hypothetical protein
MSRAWKAAAIALALAGSVAAEPQGIRDARVEERGLSTGLAREVDALARAADEPAWIAWEVPLVEGGGRICCGVRHDHGRGHCVLEPDRRGHVEHRIGDDAPRDAGPLLVLVRVQEGRIDRVRSFTADCRVHAGDRTVYHLSGVEPQPSVALLAGIVAAGGDPADEAIDAIAFHRDPAADHFLERTARSEADPGRREQAIFWLGAARGARGAAALSALIEEQPPPSVREEIAFALSVNDEPDSLIALIELARRDSSAEVRSTALFWLGQEAGERAAATIRGAVSDDPEIEVKQQAVFALSQLPPDRGVPLLIEVARSHRRPEVRQAALFWLGQSGDRRALELFEELLLD